ncbi:MAG: hypothetical protein MJZ33_07930 [Paludibacteraceae bacterium]|nr:hypothetical protein [Paludibacteraceae bacterium]
MQITGRTNYDENFYKHWKNEHPEETRTLEEMVSLLHENIDVAVEASMTWWKNFTISNNKDYATLNDLVDSDIDFSSKTIDMVGGAVNRGNIQKPPVESKERNRYTNAAKNVLVK